MFRDIYKIRVNTLGFLSASGKMQIPTARDSY